MPYKPWEVVVSDIFTIKNNALLYTVDYYRKFPVMKKTDNLLADSIIRVVKMVHAEFGLPKAVGSDAGTNFMSDKFRQFCRK